MMNNQHNKTRRHLFSIAKILIAIVLLWLLVHSSQINVKLFITLIQQPFLFSAIIVCFLLVVAGGAWRWSILNSAQGIHLGFYRSVFVTYIGSGFNNLLPSGVGGDFVRLFYVFKQAPQKKNEALLTLFLDRFFGFLAIFITISLIGIIDAHIFNRQSRVFYLFLCCAAICIGTLIIFVFFIWLSHRIQLGAWLDKKLGHKRWAKPVIAFFKTLGMFRLEKWVIVKGLMLSVVLQLLMAFIIMVIANMMGLPVLAFSNFVIAMGAIQIVSLIPITPGGIGLGEMAFSNILLMLNPGVTGAYATALLAYRLISILTYLPGLIGFMLKFKPSKEIYQQS